MIKFAKPETRFVAGGTAMIGDRRVCREIADLRWTRFPIHSLGGRPVVNVDYLEAAALAASLRGRLPTNPEWEWMASSRGTMEPYPWGTEDPSPELASFDREAGDVVGAHSQGQTRHGIEDVGGLVWEWTSSAIPGRGRYVRGGAFNSSSLQLTLRFLNGIPEEIRSPAVGLRVVWDA